MHNSSLKAQFGEGYPNISCEQLDIYLSNVVYYWPLFVSIFGAKPFCYVWIIVLRTRINF